MRYWTTLAALETVNMPSLRRGDKGAFERMFALENEVARLKEIVAMLVGAVTRGQPMTIEPGSVKG